MISISGVTATFMELYGFFLWMDFYSKLILIQNTQCFELFLRKLDLSSFEVFLNMLRVKRHRDRDHSRLSDEPGQRDLKRCRMVSLCNSLDGFVDGQVTEFYRRISRQ